MHNSYRTYIGLLIAAVVLTFLSLFISAGTYLLIHNPKAMDFLAFYTGAKLLSSSPIDLYNLHTQLGMQQHLSPIAKSTSLFIAFVNPPLVALLFMPLVNLGLAKAYALWTAINTVLLLHFSYSVYRQLHFQK